MNILWIPATLLVAFGVLAFTLRASRRSLPALVLPEGETLPSTPVQRLAARTLIVVTVLAAAAAAVVTHHGLDGTWSHDIPRWTATGLVVGALVVFAAYSAQLARWTAADHGPVDERDRAIIATAGNGQAPAMLVTLAAWMIALTEHYRVTHLIPSAALYAIFWSCIIVSVMALLAGVVIGYRRS
jgi:hypothetical protein